MTSSVPFLRARDDVPGDNLDHCLRRNELGAGTYPSLVPQVIWTGVDFFRDSYARLTKSRTAFCSVSPLTLPRGRRRGCLMGSELADSA